MNLDRRNFIIRSIGAAICAGLTPPLITALLPGPVSYPSWRVSGIDQKAGALTLEMVQSAMGYAREKSGLADQPLIISHDGYIMMQQDLHNFYVGDEVTILGG